MTRLCNFMRTEESLVQELLSMLRFSMDYNMSTPPVCSPFTFLKEMVPSQAKPKIATTEDKEKRCNSNKPFPYKTEQFPTDT